MFIPPNELNVELCMFKTIMKLLNINFVSQQLARDEIHCSVCRYLSSAFVTSAKLMFASYKGVMFFI